MTRTELSRRSFLGLLAATAAAGTARADPIAALEEVAAELALKDGTVLRFSLAEMMAASGVPGLSLAVADGYEVAWTQGYGTTGAGETARVTAHTLFQAASISKPVAATGALALVAQGKLTLDGNVNDRLISWKVPDNAFTAKEKVTLRRLISHTAGLSVHGFPGYDVDVPRPTVQQILDGAAPANTAPVRVTFEPGSRQDYSGGGITVEQLLMTDVTGQPFPELMHGLVLEPMGMSESSFVQPLPPQWATMTAAGTSQNGQPVHGRWHIYPEMAAAGLWTTPGDLARFAIGTAKARLGRANSVLPVAMMDEMFRKVPNGDILGFFSDPLNPGVFQHSGGNKGFRSLLIMNGDTGNGVAVTTNSDNGWGVMELLVRRIAGIYGWAHDFGGPVRAVWLVAATHGVDMALSHFDAVRASAQEYDLKLAGDILRATGRVDEAIRLFTRNTEVYPQSAKVFESLAEAYEATGDKPKAIANYRLSLEREPDNDWARERVKMLQQE